jgi:hypothetical protein
MHLNQDWNLITRTICRWVWNPSLQPAQSVPFGVGVGADHVLGVPFAKEPVNGWVWGAGPIVELPTITSKKLGSNVWGWGRPSSPSNWRAHSLPVCS